MKTLRTGVVGLGRIGWNFHCMELSKHDGFEVTAVVDNLEGRRQEAITKYGCKAFGTIEEMLAECPLDVVVIATPTHLHKDMAIAAFKQGCHVFLEKPMALNPDECRAIVAAAEESNQVLSVYQPHRAKAGFRHIKELIASGKIGELYHIKRGVFRYVRRNDWQSMAKFGGGMLYNYGAHYLDQLLQIAGYDVERVFCDMRCVATLGDADDVVKVLFRTKKGVLAELDINMASPIHPYVLEAWGSKGSLTMRKGILTIKTIDPASLQEKQLETELASSGRKYPSDKVDFIEEEIPVDQSFEVDFYADLHRAVTEGTAPLVDPNEAVQLMSLIENCRENAGWGS